MRNSIPAVIIITLMLTTILTAGLLPTQAAELELPELKQAPPAHFQTFELVRTVDLQYAHLEVRRAPWVELITQTIEVFNLDNLTQEGGQNPQATTDFTNTVYLPYVGKDFTVLSIDAITGTQTSTADGWVYKWVKFHISGVTDYTIAHLTLACDGTTVRDTYEYVYPTGVGQIWWYWDDPYNLPKTCTITIDPVEFDWVATRTWQMEKSFSAMSSWPQLPVAPNGSAWQVGPSTSFNIGKLIFPIGDFGPITAWLSIGTWLDQDNVNAEMKVFHGYVVEAEGYQTPTPAHPPYTATPTRTVTPTIHPTQTRVPTASPTWTFVSSR